MTNAEIIKRLEAIATCELVLDEQKIGKITKQAFEAIQETASLAISALERAGWISVEERLPEDGKNVLCRVEKECMYYDDAGGEVFVMDAYIIEGHYRKGKYKGWYRAVAPDIGSYTNNVTHWMPLPEPLKEET